MLNFPYRKTMPSMKQTMFACVIRTLYSRYVDGVKHPAGHHVFVLTSLTWDVGFPMSLCSASSLSWPMANLSSLHWIQTQLCGKKRLFIPMMPRTNRC